MTPKHAVIVIDPCKIQKLVEACIGNNEKEAIRFIGANNIGVPKFVGLFNYPGEQNEDFFDMKVINNKGDEYRWAIPREACKSILYV